MSAGIKSMTLKELESVLSEGRPFIVNRRILEFRDVAPDLPRGLEDLAGGRNERFLLLLEDEDAAHRRIVRLLVSLKPDLNFLCLTPRPQPRPKKNTGSAFARKVDALLSGARLIDAEPAGRDRIASLSLVDGSGRNLRMMVELFGRHPNLLVLDENDVVIAAFRETTGTRSVKTGEPYPPPPPSSGGRRAAARAVRFEPGKKDVLPEIALNKAADLFFAELDVRLRLAEIKAALKRKLSRTLRRLKEKVAALEKRIDAAGEAEIYRRQGDLLKAHFHLVKRGMDSIEVPDVFSDAQRRVVIPLDPKRDPAANLEALYGKYGKLTRSLGPLRDTLRRTVEESAGIETALGELEKSETMEEIASVRERVVPLTGREPRGRASGVGARKERLRTSISGVRRFRSPEGLALLVGRDGEVNHRLLQAARGRDLWLHCHDTPGAHVIVPLERGKTASLETLLAAGLLAVHFSRLRGADRADVVYTERKFVRAIKGEKRGRVTVERFKTLHVRSDPERIKALLATAEP